MTQQEENRLHAEERTPIRYKKATYSDVPESIRARFEQMKETRNGLYLHGGVGCGKTHVAYALYKQSADSVKTPALFYNVSELLREMKLDYSRENKDKKFFEDKVMNFKGLLFLDDIGSERMTDWVEEMFYLIVNKRYNNMLPIVFTSNLSIPELAERVGDRIASRIVGSCDVEKLSGNDRRLR
jgi:DNA replication protein DnaC